MSANELFRQQGRVCSFFTPPTLHTYARTRAGIALLSVSKDLQGARDGPVKGGMDGSAVRRHPASLVPRCLHDPSLLELVRSPVTADMIRECITWCQLPSLHCARGELTSVFRSEPFLFSPRLYRTKDGRRHPLRSGHLRRALVAADDSFPGRSHRSARAVAARRAATRDVHLDSRAEIERPSSDPALYAHLPRPAALEATRSGARHGVDATSGLSRDSHCGSKKPEWCAPSLAT